MNATLQSLLAALSSDLGYEAIPSPTVTARLTRYISEGYRHLLSMPELGPLRLNMLTFMSVAGQRIYGVPQALVEIHQVVDPTSAIRLRLMTLDVLRALDPQRTSSGTPTHYIPVGYHPVQRDPDHSAIYVTSDNASDTTQTITLRAILNYDDIDASSVVYTATLNGLTPVLVAPSIQAIQSYTIVPAAVGTIQLHDAPDLTPAHRLSSMPPGQNTTQYLGIRLWPTPSDARVYQVDGILTLADLSQQSDLSLLPTDFEFILTDYARMREYEYRDDSRVTHAAARYEQKLKYFRNRVMNPPDYRPRVGRIEDRSTNIGDGYFPPGRW